MTEPTDLRLDRNLVISAGAGSGKTHALVTLALGLYAGAGRPSETPIDPARAWIVTFTEKAAAELRQRLVQRVRGLVRAPPGPEHEPDLLAALSGKVPSRDHWEGILRALPVAPIGTFHSLAARVLRAYAHRLDVPTDFSVMDERSATLSMHAALDEVMLEDLESGDSTRPTRALVGALGDRHAVRRGVLGLARRLASEGLRPRDLDPPESSRVEHEERFAVACGALAAALDALAVTTVPRLTTAAQVLAWERESIGRCAPDAMEHWFPSVGRVMDAPRGRGGWSKAMRAVLEPLRTAWSVVQETSAALREAELVPLLLDLMARTVDRHAEGKLRHGALDFSDLMLVLRDGLRDDLDLRRRVKAGLDVVLVDEFQDTNHVQLDLVRLLAERRDRDRALGRGDSTDVLELAPAVLAAVGDRKQSIYEFRGADVGAFNALLRRAEAEPASWRLAVLNRSWRSTPALVAYANACFERTFVSAENTAEFEVRWRAGPGGDALDPVRGPSEDTAVRWIVSECDQADPLNPPEQAGRSVLEPDRVAGYLARAVRDGEVDPGETAVLVRTNARLAEYRDALERAGVRAVILGGRGLLAAPEVRDGLAVLAAIASPQDASASAAMWRSITVGLDDDTLAALALNDRLNLANATLDGARDVQLTDQMRARLELAIERFQAVASLVHAASPAVAWDVALRAFDVERAWCQRAWPDGVRANLARVRELLLERSEMSIASAARSLRERDRAGDPEAPGRPARIPSDAVRLMTIHAAKGLEFSTVVVPELGRDADESVPSLAYDRELGLSLATLDPSGRATRSPAGVAVVRRLTARRAAESWRLLYVAFTRARDGLVLCGDPPERPGATNWARHLRALGEALASHVEDVAVAPPVRAALPPIERRAALHVRRAPPAPARAAPDATGQLSLFASADAAGESPTPATRADRSPTHRPPPTEPVAVGVTALQTFARCARRYWLERVMQLESPTPVGDGEAEDGSPPRRIDTATVDARELGERVHAVQEHVDLSRADVEGAVRDACARAGVVDPETIEGLVAFWRGEVGTRVRDAFEADARRVLRELPIALVLAEGRAVVRGQLDALIVGDSGGLEILDYKRSRHPSPRRYAFQMQTYAVVVDRLFATAPRVDARLVWLGPTNRTDAIRTDADTLDAHAAELDRIAAALIAALQHEHDPSAWPKLEVPTSCGACPHRERCWPDEALTGPENE